MQVLVLGLGNILLGDEGVGVRVIQRLFELYDFPRGVRVMDGGTLGIELLPYLEETSRLLVVDAVQAHRPPGTLVRLVGDQIPSFLDAAKVSVHQQGLQDLLAVAILKDYLPDEVVFCGVQVERLGIGLELSPVVEAQVDVLVEEILAELVRWNVRPQRKGDV